MSTEASITVNIVSTVQMQTSYSVSMKKRPIDNKGPGNEDIVYCDSCGTHRGPSTTSRVKFFLCNCQHIMCQNCVVHPKANGTVCTKCRNFAKAIEINDKLPDQFKLLVDTDFLQKHMASLNETIKFRELRVARRAKANMNQTNGSLENGLRTDLKQIIERQERDKIKLQQQVVKLKEENKNLTIKLKEQKDGMKKAKEGFKKLLSKYDAIKEQSVCTTSGPLTRVQRMPQLPHLKQSLETPANRITMGATPRQSVISSMPGSAASLAKRSRLSDPRYTFSTLYKLPM